MLKRCIIVGVLVLTLTLCVNAQCVNLSDSTTWPGNLQSVGNRSFIVQDNVTLCTQTFTTDTIHNFFIMNDSYTLDCNGSTITGGGLGTAVLSTHNDTRLQNCMLNNFGVGGNILSTYANETPMTTWNWTQRPTGGPDIIRSVAVDQEGYYILAGYDGIGLFDTGWRVVKIDRENNTLWNWTQDPSSADELYSVAVDQDGNYILAGIDWIPGNKEWRAVKLDKNGNTLWTWTQDVSNWDDELYSVAVDQDGNYILAGGDRALGVGNLQWRVVKVDTNGNTIWNWTQNVAPGLDLAYSVAVDQDGNYVAGGQDTLPGFTQWRVVKIDKNNQTLWNWTQDPAPGAGDAVASVAVDQEGNYVIAGTDNINPQIEWRVVKLDRNNQTLWNWTQSPSPNHAYLYSVAVDQENNYVLAGTYDPGPGFIGWRAVKIDKNNQTLWNWTQNPSANSDNAYGVAVDQEGNYIIAGDDQTFFGNTHMRTVKLSPIGRVMSGIVLENVSIYKQNMSTYAALPNASVNMTNVAFGYNSTVGKILYGILNAVNGTLATTWNVLFDPFFVSINSSDYRASFFNASANVTIRSNTTSCTINYYKLSGFPQNRTIIATNGTNITPAYTTCTNGLTTFSTVNAFSGYAAGEGGAPPPPPPTPTPSRGGGGGARYGYYETLYEEVEEKSTPVEVTPAPVQIEETPLMEEHTETVEEVKEVYSPGPTKKQKVETRTAPKSKRAELAAKTVLYALPLIALIALMMMAYKRRREPSLEELEKQMKEVKEILKKIE